MGSAIGMTNDRLEKIMKSRTRIALIVFLTITLTNSMLLASQRFWSLHDLIAFSDVVAIIEVTAVEESEPRKGNAGDCRTGGMVRDVSATFSWTERIAQCPYAKIPEGESLKLTFARALYGEEVGPGQHLAFLQQNSADQFTLAAYPRYSIFPVTNGGIEFPRSWRYTEDASALSPLTSVEEARSIVQKAKIPDQPQTFTASTVRIWNNSSEPLGQSMRRFTSNTKESLGGTRADSQYGFHTMLAGYFNCSSLNETLHLKAMSVEPKSRRFVISGDWIDGYFVATKITSILDSDELLNADPAVPLDEAAAINIAKEAVAANEKWDLGAKYEARRDGEGWSVIVWRITGYDQDGSPQFTPGGHRIVSIDVDGKVTRYSIGC